MTPFVLLVSMRLQVMLWLLVGIWMFAGRYKRRSHFALRISLTAIGCIALATLLGIAGYLILNHLSQIDYEHYSKVYPMLNLIVHFMMYGITIGGMCICYDERFITIMFGSVAAYASQNIAMLFTNIFGNVWPETKFLSLAPITWLSTMTWLCTYVFTYLAIYFAFARNIKDTADVARYNSGPTIVLFLIVIVVAVAIRSLASSRNKDGGTMFVMMCIINIVCCLFVLFVQFLLTKKMVEQRESDALRHISELKMRQYEFTKENIDIINIKCHDLKHQLLELKNKGNVDKEYIDELSQSVLFYDSIVKTGNDALDVVITDKNLYCVKNQVKLTVIADGKQLEFMQNADIYSLFGNALDNAIEHVMALPPEKRMVKLSVSLTGSLVSISIKNYYEGESPQIVSGLPRTTKKDTAIHGYGTKSIKSIASKYGGSLSILVENNQFIVSILIPVDGK